MEDKNENTLQETARPLMHYIWVGQFTKKFTCSELKMVKSQANTVVLELTANSPSTQVKPNNGSKANEATNNVLWVVRVQSIKQ